MRGRRRLGSASFTSSTASRGAGSSAATNITMASSYSTPQFTTGGDEYVEVTVDFIGDESMILLGAKPSGKLKTPALTSQTPTTLRASTSNSVSRELRGDITKGKKPFSQQKEKRSGDSQALRLLRFISRRSKVRWDVVEIKFKKHSFNGYLYRDKFPNCIRMKDSIEFALQLFDVLREGIGRGED